MAVHLLEACAECDSTDIQLVTGATIYPHRHDLHALYFWQCQDCEAYVGTHKGTAYDMMHAATGVSHIYQTTEDDCNRVLQWLDSL